MCYTANTNKHHSLMLPLPPQWMQIHYNHYNWQNKRQQSVYIRISWLKCVSVQISNFWRYAKIELESTIFYRNFFQSGEYAFCLSLNTLRWAGELVKTREGFLNWSRYFQIFSWHAIVNSVYMSTSTQYSWAHGEISFYNINELSWVRL